jgi:hypothetical protein
VELVVRVQDLFNFIYERHSIHTKRALGLPKPWTDDPILQSYRFCNAYRELDRETIWIKENWRDPHKYEPEVWFAMAVARFVNWSPTLAEIGYPVPWDERVSSYTMKEHFVNTLKMREQAGEKVWTGAYLIHAGKGGSKVAHVADNILTPLWERRDFVLEATFSCEALSQRLQEFNGIGSFMAGQIVCDTKYTRLLDTAQDWWEFVVPGPGSLRGLNRVMDRPVNQRWKPSEWRVELLLLKTRIGPLFLNAGMPPISAQDLQNCLCEFDKYERVRLGEGRPRNNFAGKAEV